MVLKVFEPLKFYCISKADIKWSSTGAGTVGGFNTILIRVSLHRLLAGISMKEKTAFSRTPKTRNGLAQMIKMIKSAGLKGLIFIVA